MAPRCELGTEKRGSSTLSTQALGAPQSAAGMPASVQDTYLQLAFHELGGGGGGQGLDGRRCAEQTVWGLAWAGMELATSKAKGGKQADTREECGAGPTVCRQGMGTWRPDVEPVGGTCLSKLGGRSELGRREESSKRRHMVTGHTSWPVGVPKPRWGPRVHNRQENSIHGVIQAGSPCDVNKHENK